MFESLSEKLDSIFSSLKGRGLLKEEDIDAAMKEAATATAIVDTQSWLTYFTATAADPTMRPNSEYVDNVRPA